MKLVYCRSKENGHFTVWDASGINSAILSYLSGESQFLPLCHHTQLSPLGELWILVICNQRSIPEIFLCESKGRPCFQCVDLQLSPTTPSFSSHHPKTLDQKTVSGKLDELLGCGIEAVLPQAQCMMRHCAGGRTGPLPGQCGAGKSSGDASWHDGGPLRSRVFSHMVPWFSDAPVQNLKEKDQREASVSFHVSPEILGPWKYLRMSMSTRTLPPLQSLTHWSIHRKCSLLPALSSHGKNAFRTSWPNARSTLPVHVVWTSQLLRLSGFLFKICSLRTEWGARVHVPHRKQLVS